MTQLLFRSVAIDDYLGIRLDIVRGFLVPPDYRGTDIVIPGRRGRISGNRVEDVREVILEGYVAGTSAADWRTKTDILLGILEEGGSIEPGILLANEGYLGLAPGAIATISARVKNAVEGPIRFGSSFQTWSVALESVDADWLVS